MRANRTAAYRALTTTTRIHESASLMKLFASPMTKSFCRITVPRLPISSSTTPFQPSRPASVTTNDGMPSLVTSVPWNMPIAAPAPQREDHRDERRRTRCRRA